jgi:hypothetical protein
MILAALNQISRIPICEKNNISGNEWYVFLPQEQKFVQYIPESATIGHNIHATETNTDMFYGLPKSVQTVLQGHRNNII